MTLLRVLPRRRRSRRLSGSRPRPTNEGPSRQSLRSLFFGETRARRRTKVHARTSPLLPSRREDDDESVERQFRADQGGERGRHCPFSTLESCEPDQHESRTNERPETPDGTRNSKRRADLQDAVSLKDYKSEPPESRVGLPSEWRYRRCIKVRHKDSPVSCPGADLRRAVSRTGPPAWCSCLLERPSLARLSLLVPRGTPKRGETIPPR